MEHRILALDQIELKDERFRTSYFFSLDQLILSIKKIGLLYPPCVVLRDNHFVLVSGWRRVLACLKLSFSSTEVLVLKERDDLRAFLATFYENLGTRDFSLVEKAEVLSRLKKFGLSKAEIQKYYFPLLGIPPSPFHLDIFLALADFDLSLKKSIHEKNMTFPIVRLLSELRPGERTLVLPLLLPLGQNKREEILQDLVEISRRDDVIIEEILGDPEIQKTLNSRKLSPFQKAEKIRLALRKIRFPRLSSRQESFERSLKKVHWPEEIGLKPSAFFEEDSLALTFRFKNKKEFQARVSKLQELASQPELSQILKKPSDV
jgi:ParB family chromosome partitioning protein